MAHFPTRLTLEQARQQDAATTAAVYANGRYQVVGTDGMPIGNRSNSRNQADVKVERLAQRGIVTRVTFP